MAESPPSILRRDPAAVLQEWEQVALGPVALPNSEINCQQFLLAVHKAAMALAGEVMRGAFA